MPATLLHSHSLIHLFIRQTFAGHQRWRHCPCLALRQAHVRSLSRWQDQKPCGKGRKIIAQSSEQREEQWRHVDPEASSLSADTTTDSTVEFVKRDTIAVSQRASLVFIGKLWYLEFFHAHWHAHLHSTPGPTNHMWNHTVLHLIPRFAC